METTLSRMRFVSSSLRERRSYTSSTAIWLPPRWCIVIVWRTTAAVLHDGVELGLGHPRGSLSFAFMPRICSSFARFCGDEMNRARKGFPSLDLPRSTSRRFFAVFASAWVLDELVPVGELAILAHAEAEELLRRRQIGRARRLRTGAQRAGRADQEQHEQRPCRARRGAGDHRDARRRAAGAAFTGFSMTAFAVRFFVVETRSRL